MSAPLHHVTRCKARDDGGYFIEYQDEEGTPVIIVSVERLEPGQGFRVLDGRVVAVEGVGHG